MTLERIGVHGGCRLRHLRQEAGLRKQPSLVAQDHRSVGFNPNIQRVRATVNGTPKRLNVCTGCLKAGKVSR